MTSNQETIFNRVMQPGPASATNVRLAVPFFGVRDMDASLRFYVEGLGFRMTRYWKPEDRVRWCWLELGDAAIMLQEFWMHDVRGGAPDTPFAPGMCITFMCADALAIYHGAKARGLAPSRPVVGNNMWVTVLHDPDGYRIEFESVTDVPEETVYEDPA